MPKKAPARYRLVLSTCPNLTVAKRIATRLVRDRLAACVNIVPLAQSIYRWRGKVESAREVLLLVKIRRGDYKRVERRIEALHPYELPEIVSVGIAEGYARYLAWLGDPDRIDQ
jgi:periplasmic divalent cation tolerance protein